jgi:DNA-binding MarR family transcriptional regulator
VWVVLTAEGRRAVATAMRDHTDAIREYFFDVLDDEHKTALLNASRRVLDVINPPICVDEADRVDVAG